MLDDLLPYYENELTALRTLSKEFAGRYPKIASRLMLDGDICEDPHVERLIESFAFVASRIHKKLDDEFPQITDALLGVLYPHFLRPVPSMSIAQLSPAPGSQLSTMQLVPRGTELLTRPVSGIPVRYRTAYPVEVWPLQVAEARLEPLEKSAFATTHAGIAANLHLRIEATGQTPLNEMSVDRIRFYLDGEGPLVHTLYELLLNNVKAITVTTASETGGRVIQQLGPGNVHAVGYAEDEGLLDYDARSFLGYRLIQEYFVLPEKFLFIELQGLDLSQLPQAEAGGVNLSFHLGQLGRPERMARLEQTVNRSNFRLNCTPIVNLFSQQAEPIRISQEQHQYPVVPDVRRPLGVEIYSIDSVNRFSRNNETSSITEFLPFYSTRHGTSAHDSGCYWYAQRLTSARPDDDGTEVSIALVDLDMNPQAPSVETLSLKLTCTNRDLPGKLPYGGDDNMLKVENGGAIPHARLLKKPTATWRAPMRQANQWRLVSHLSLNHLSIVDGGREALLEILSLYNFSDNASLRKQIAGIVDISTRPTVTRVGRAPHQAFVRGNEIELTVDEDQYIGSGAYLLARVMDLFFGLYCTANSFTRLIVRSRQREEPLAVFPPRNGDLHLL